MTSPAGGAEVVPEHWAAALARSRDVVNPAVAGLTTEGVTTEAVATALREVGPAFETHCSSLPPEHQDAWATALALAAVRALGARQWSPRTIVPWTVTELLPRLARHVADPQQVVPDVVHAAGQVWRCADAGRWGRLLLASAADAGRRESLSGNAVRDLGVVAAWRAGHVRLRAAAHRVGAALPVSTLGAVLDVGPAELAHDTLAANLAEPSSWPPDEEPSEADVALRTVGGFVGWGGPFLRPPVVVGAIADGTRIRIREAVEWDLLLDVHGSWLHRVDPTDDDPAGRPAAATPVGGRTTYGRTVLVTSPRSHVLVHARGPR